MDFMNDQHLTTSDTFDKDFSQSSLHNTDNLFHHPVDLTDAYTAQHPVNGKTLYLEYDDPLKYAGSLQFEPIAIQLGDQHFVNPHDVKGYYRHDGTYVEGYYRDGDGDTDINRTAAEGGGYFRR